MKRNKSTALFAVLLASVLVLSGCASKKPASVRPELLEGQGYTTANNNLHQIDGPAPGKNAPMAFRVYRSGAPSRETFAKWCGEYKIKRVIVLAGDAAAHEILYQKDGVCPDIQVLYNVTQSVSDPPGDKFLQLFDQMIEQAKKDQVGILLRCQTGSHRAGRTAAYYQMKYQGLSADEAIAIMNYNGMMMPMMDPKLVPEVRAMYDYIHDKPCSQKEKFCIAKNSNKYMP
jgi:protein-tyrosine phosphatase